MHARAATILARYAEDLNVERTEDPSVEVVLAGIGLLVAQSIIASNAFFNEHEIKKFLALRRAFHPQFAAACGQLADDIDAGLHGAGVKTAAPALRSISKLPATQDRQALVQTVRLMRPFRQMHGDDISRVMHRLIREVSLFATADDTSSRYAEDYTDFFKNLLRLDAVPQPMKTYLRKVIQIGKGQDKSLRLVPHEDAEPGVWFDLPPDEQGKVRQQVQDAEAVFSERFEDKTPEERQVLYQNADKALKQVQRQVGVHLDVVKKEEEAPKEPLADVLKRESKQEMDGGSLFIMQEVIKSFESSAKYQTHRQQPYKPDWKEEQAPVPRDAGKIVTLLRKAKTLDTAKRICQEASERGIVGRSFLKDMEKTFEKLQQNKAIKDGVPLVALHFEPKTVEEFQQQHDTGDVELPQDMPEDQRKELLGKVSRAIQDLEGIFGRGFCGKHQKKLAFRFGGSTNFMAKAHYFVWDDRRTWQPRVTFGEDYEGVLAHELSHYFEDLIAYKVDEKRKAVEGRGKYDLSGGPGDIFGRSSAAYFVETRAPKGTDEPPDVSPARRDYMNEELPEAYELMAAVTKTPDYARWEDKLGSAYETALPKAVENLTGKSMYDLPKDHPYAKAGDAQYKSELPPELIAEAEKVFSKLMDGDTRKLKYYQSAVEVWARMCEQYVYTKLSRSGIVNPWLTWLTYEQDTYVDQPRFEKEIEPIFNRLFAKLGTRNILARILARFRAYG